MNNELMIVVFNFYSMFSFFIQEKVQTLQKTEYLGNKYVISTEKMRDQNAKRHE